MSAISSSPALAVTMNHAEIVQRYRRLREVSSTLNSEVLVPRIPTDVLQEGGRTLGILRRGVFVFKTEDETSVLMDYCIHDIRRGGQTVVERLLAESPPGPGSDEMLVLEAMRQARYSLFLIEEVVSGVGVRVRDLLRDTSEVLVDINLSRTAAVNLVLAARLIRPADFSMSTGATLPIPDVALFERILAELTRLFGIMRHEDFRVLSPATQSQLPAVIIRACLEGDASSSVRYEDPENARSGRVPAPHVSRTPRAGRNDPCPCGSGKKFKKCCGASAARV
jgi:hypothetical protein